MRQIIEAIYENGVLRPTQPLDLADGTAIKLIVVESCRSDYPAGVEQPPELTEEDEAILDRIWDKIAKEESTEK